MNNVCNNARETLNRCLGLIFLLTKVVSLSKGGNSLLETFFFFKYKWKEAFLKVFFLFETRSLVLGDGVNA